MDTITPERIDALREEGVSYSEIGALNGETKDAVRGRHQRWLARKRRDVAAARLRSPAVVDGAGGGDAERNDGHGSDDVSQASLTTELRASLRDAQRRLAKKEASAAELVEAVERAVTSAALSIEVPPVPRPSPDARSRGEEVAVAVLSDWQLGKRTPSYDSDVCADRIDRFAEKVIRLTAIQRADHPVKHLRVHVLGDIAEGEQIFPGQAHLIDSSLFEQTVERGPTILISFLTRMLSYFETVHVSAVIGNHGRIGRKGDFNPQTNADRMIYRNTQRILEGRLGFERLTWDIPSVPNERAWYAISRIGNYSALLIHGDQFRGTAGIPWYGLQKKAGGWALGAITEEFTDVDFGHFHQPTRVTLNNVTARCSGSPESHNDFAAEQLAAVGRPSQSLRFVHPERGIVTAEYVVWLD